VGVTLTDFDVHGSALVHPHGEHGVLEHNSNLVQQLLLQGCTVELLPSVSRRRSNIHQNTHRRRPIVPPVPLRELSCSSKEAALFCLARLLTMCYSLGFTCLKKNQFSENWWICIIL